MSDLPPLGQQLHCHHCQRWIGETSQSLVFVGMFKDPRDRERVEGHRDTYRCPSCKWSNVFQSPAAATFRDYRHVETKDRDAA